MDDRGDHSDCDQPVEFRLARHRPCTSASARFCRPALSPPYECLERRVPHFTKIAASQYDITPIEMARASLIGQPVHILSPLVASTYLLVSMLDVNLG
jgi:hypothetical protein